MSDIDDFVQIARDMQRRGSSESYIKDFLYKQGLNDYQVGSILASLKPPKVAGAEQDYVQLRYGIKLRRWQIVLAMRLVAFLLGTAIIAGLVGASMNTGKSLADSTLLLIFAGGLILFSTGLLDRFL